MQLRPYQSDAVGAVYNHLRTRDDNPCVVIPTGGGKTPVIAQLCADAVKLWAGRVLVLCPVKELIEQAADKLAAVCPDIELGIYSAGLNRRDTQQPIIVGGIHSIYERACDLGKFDLIVPDEGHLIPPDGDGMYRRLLGDLKVINPNARVVGLTATPFRLSSGLICTPDGFLNHVCFDVGVRQLIVDGYLSPLTSRAGRTKVDTSELHIRGGEFVASEVEQLMGDDSLVAEACREIVELTANRKSILIFAAGVNHANDVAAVLSLRYGLRCQAVTGETPSAERAAAVQAFKSGELQALVNVNIFTTGFDAPNVDCVVLLRPTMSPGLYYQMVGRGFRLSPGKNDCLVLDFGGNVLRHGPIDNLKTPTAKDGKPGEAPAKECPQCRALIAAGYCVCPECGYTFPPPERSRHEATASDADILSGITITRYEVQDTLYTVHYKRGAPEAPPTMRVDYQIAVGQYKSEWICFEHEPGSFAQRKAAQWWFKRSSEPLPTTVAAAVNLCKWGSVAQATAITVRSVTGERFDSVVDHELGPIPSGEDEPPVTAQQLEEVPF